MKHFRLILFLLTVILLRLLAPKAFTVSVWYPVVITAAAGLFVLAELWAVRREKTAGAVPARTDWASNILAAFILTGYMLAGWFGPELRQEVTYASIAEKRERKAAENTAGQLANFAAQTGARTNDWSLPVVGGPRRMPPAIGAQAVREAFSGESNAVVISLVPREVKFSASEDLPNNFNHVLTGLHVAHSVSNAAFEVQVAVKDNFWQMLQFGNGQATELLVALRGIRLENEQPSWSKKPKLILKGHAFNVQWFDPQPHEEK